MTSRWIDGNDGNADQALRRRLETGWHLIDQAERAGDDARAERLIEHWLRLLGEYAATFNEWKSTVEHGGK